jgi:hypothetical protein
MVRLRICLIIGHLERSEVTRRYKFRASGAAIVQQHPRGAFFSLSRYAGRGRGVRVFILSSKKALTLTLSRRTGRGDKSGAPGEGIRAAHRERG